MSTDSYITLAQLVTRRGNAVTTGTPSNWRSQWKGPAYVKPGRSVRYTLAAVTEYEAGNTNAKASGAA
ncbi:putative MerR transcription regulator [Xanthomonas phage FoX5]|uniref:Putative MerR transcription regulator n=1 Tax=Xanthomonas phage FoX5 TaxID=2723901 RepID=A0A858NQ24_9CAUD|nr:putative MerR transcription regulator [Xanthomonas phage FoX5]QJB22015.1 putative MerR transcription regulator [Xanthomonas phage FoX5]